MLPTRALAMAPLSPALYHHRTKHHLQRYAAGPDVVHWDAQPDLFRRYEGAPTVSLPLVADTVHVPYADLYRPAAIAPHTVTLESLSLLLETSVGLSAWKQVGAARWSLRCNPSSGNLHPTETYLLVQGHVPGLPAGLYHYRADLHAVELRAAGPPPAPGAALPTPAVWVGLSSVHWREAWKYGERAYRYCQHDVGHALAALSFAAASLGWRLCPLLEAGDATVAALLGLDRPQDFVAHEEEHPDLLLAVHPRGASPARDLSAVSVAERLRGAEWHGKAAVLDPRHGYHWPVLDEVATACRRPDHCSPPPAPDLPPLPAPLATPSGITTSTLFRQRRSAQAFDGRTGLPLAAFARLLDRLLPRRDVPPWDAVPWKPAVHLAFFVHRVEGLTPGLYLFPRDETAVPLLRAQLREDSEWLAVPGLPPHLRLYRLLAGRAGPLATKLSCHQDIAGDSAFSLGMLAEFEARLAGAPWRYRELFWEAGVVGQVLYLEAEVSGLRGTGIGCYFDDEVHAVLGLRGAALQSLYHFTVGGSVEDARLLTLPPYDVIRRATGAPSPAAHPVAAASMYPSPAVAQPNLARLSHGML